MSYGRLQVKLVSEEDKGDFFIRKIEVKEEKVQCWMRTRNHNVTGLVVHILAD